MSTNFHIKEKKDIVLDNNVNAFKRPKFDLDTGRYSWRDGGALDFPYANMIFELKTRYDNIPEPAKELVGGRYV